MRPTNIQIDSLAQTDWEQVRAIYLEGIATGNATFETEAPDWESWDAAHLPCARLVARYDGSIAGWAALSPVSRRRVYRGVAEATVYVRAAHRGKGIGRILLMALIEASEENGIWTLQAGIFPENTASLALTRACGFREVGRRERMGQHGGVWRDVILLERRSPIVGAP
jgi:phosphinothricin acetyltransferase